MPSLKKLKPLKLKNCYSNDKNIEADIKKITPKTQILSPTQGYIKSVISDTINYILGETSRNLNKKIMNIKKDFKSGNTNNVLVSHNI